MHGPTAHRHAWPYCTQTCVALLHTDMRGPTAHTHVWPYCTQTCVALLHAHYAHTSWPPSCAAMELIAGTHLQPAGHGVLAKGALGNSVEGVAIIPLQRILAGNRHSQLQGGGDDLHRGRG
jgi:hypothetical protein